MFSRSMLVARTRVWAQRVDLSRWALAITLGLVAAFAVGSAISRADARAARYGATQPVFVLAVDVARGSVIDASAVRLEHRPRALVPPTAAAEDPTGATTRRALVAGQVLVTTDVAPLGALASGSLGVPVPHNAETLPVASGDHVALHAVTIDRAGASLITPRALVVEVTPLSVVVGVDPSTAAEIAWVLANGAITVSLAP